MPVREVTGIEPAPVTIYILIGLAFLAAAILIPIFSTAGGGFLVIGAIVSFVRASRAHKSNRAATGR